jgi:hypothetical protein
MRKVADQACLPLIRLQPPRGWGDEGGDVVTHREGDRRLATRGLAVEREGKGIVLRDAVALPPAQSHRSGQRG